MFEGVIKFRCPVVRTEDNQWLNVNTLGTYRTYFFLSAAY